MTLMTLLGCILIAFGPAAVIFLVAVARDHFHVIIMISRRGSYVFVRFYFIICIVFHSDFF